MAVELIQRDDVAVVTMVDDGKRNTLSGSHVEQMLNAFAQARDARAIIIAPRGKVFCAGADISAFAATEKAAGDESAKLESPAMNLFQALLAEKRLVIAAVQGGAFGGGFEMALCCDLVVAAPEAFFMFPEAGFGALPPIGLARLPRLIGARRTLELAAMRRKLLASEAFSMGLVSRVVPATELIDDAVALAREAVATGAPGSIAAIKAALAETVENLPQAAERYSSRLVEAEWREGFSAFVEKRPIDFTRFWKSRT